MGPSPRAGRLRAVERGNSWLVLLSLGGILIGELISFAIDELLARFQLHPVASRMDLRQLRMTQ